MNQATGGGSAAGYTTFVVTYTISQLPPAASILLRAEPVKARNN
ncbi:MAG: hypothetical protein AAFR37_02300 [Cyanobacteria bacterium J06628_3]